MLTPVTLQNKIRGLGSARSPDIIGSAAGADSRSRWHNRHRNRASLRCVLLSMANEMEERCALTVRVKFHLFTRYPQFSRATGRAKLNASKNQNLFGLILCIGIHFSSLERSL